MNKKIVKEAFDYITKSKFTLFIILYLIFGSFLFTNQYRYENYIVIFSVSLWRTTYMLIFIFPPLLYIVLKLYNFFYTNKNTVIRLENRKKIWNNYIISLITIILYYFIIITLCMAVAVNITLHSFDFKTYALDYDSIDLIIFIIQFIKFYFILLLLSLLLSAIILGLKSVKLYISLGYFATIIIYCSELPFLFYLVDYRYTTKASTLLVNSIVSYSFFMIIFYFSSYLISQKSILGIGAVEK